MDTTKRRPGDTYARALPWQVASPVDGRWGQVCTDFDGAYCRYCGRSGRDCPKDTCLACGTPQCSNGSGCLVCFAGFVGRPPFMNETCGYARCDRQAVARVPRVRVACLADLGQAKSHGRSVADSIADRLRLRDRGGQDWQHLVWFGPPLYYAVRRWHDDGRSGWTTGLDPAGFETAGQADREAQAWEDPAAGLDVGGWHAERVTLTPEVRDDIARWEAGNTRLPRGTARS
jgi:hypothetical protein